MVKRATGRKRSPQRTSSADSSRTSLKCQIRAARPMVFAANVSGERQRALVMNSSKWVNGTALRYAFFSNTERFRSFAGTTQLKSQVRKAFARWTEAGIGLRFEEVSDVANAQVRIGFLEGDGHWSYIGREILQQGADDRTMNLDPSDAISSGAYGVDVACHEIGHTLGFPHEHQNPKAGIVWNEEAVYRTLGGPPNNWSRETTFHNIIEKIAPDEVQGSAWDPNSIMHYPFEAGLIASPAEFQDGLTPPGGLSERDISWVRTFYPPLAKNDEKVLPLLQSERLQFNPGQKRSYLLKPTATRYYELRTFGLSDTVVVLYERSSDGTERYLTADDDSGEERNAYIRRRLQAGRTYLMRLRLYYASAAGETGVMWW
jgi:hypothetical protein